MLTLTNIIKYFNYTDFEYVPSFIESELIRLNINYIWLDVETLATGYIINDHIVIPILTTYDIYLKTLNNTLLLIEYLKRYNNKIFKSKYKFLCKEFIKLPQEIILKILSY